MEGYRHILLTEGSSKDFVGLSVFKEIKFIIGRDYETRRAYGKSANSAGNN